MDLRKIVLDGFMSGKLHGKTLKSMPAALRLSPSYKKQVKEIVRRLVKEGVIINDGNGCYDTPARLGAFVATVRAKQQGFAFLTPKDGGNDYFTPKRKLKEALDGDVVLAVHVKGTADEAVVVKVLERGKKSIIGRLVVDRRSAFVVPDDRAFARDVRIPYSLLNGADDGDKVVAEITSYPHEGALGGRVTEVLGRDGDMYVEEEAIIRSYGFNTQFAEYVTETAEKVAKEPVQLTGRRDLRELLTVTIDGADTRDIDDAVSLERVGENLRLGVHIADVSHYVKPNGCIDKEAYDRGTSVYFPDRVLPMLPTALSNGACSLNEGEDRYAMSCFITFAPDGKRIASELCESVIRSDRRLTYDEVTAILDDPETGKQYGEIAAMLGDMARLCLVLEGVRAENGEVTLDVKEAHIYLNERGEIVIPDYERALSHRIIEQFMVSANEAVAAIAEKHKAPFLYRVHEKPSPEKASLLFGFLRELGVNARGDCENCTPHDYRAILKRVEDKPYAAVVNKVMLRSMQKARYCEDNLGHFGLASERYCHFTSPIRRYPDLFVHRVLKEILHGTLEENREKYSDAHTAATDTSERERRADLAERDVDDLYKAVYMSKRIGESYDAVISGVIESGIFAELPNTVEGFIRFDCLPYDRYEFFPEKFLLKGNSHSFRIGEKITVKVAGCDFGSRRVQFVLN